MGSSGFEAALAVCPAAAQAYSKYCGELPRFRIRFVVPLVGLSRAGASEVSGLELLVSVPTWWFRLQRSKITNFRSLLVTDSSFLHLRDL